MLKAFYLLFIFFFLSCKEENSNAYFYEITKEIIPVRYERGPISKIQERELEKFKKYNNEKYLIGSKYAQLFLYHEGDSSEKSFVQIPLVFQLLWLNNDKHSFISMACYALLAFQFENTSPDLAMKFIDDAIRFNKKDPKEYFIAHLYHMKGRLYFNDQKYSKAQFYFQLALRKFPKDDFLYVASMYNNFGLVYNKIRNNKRAIEEVGKGIEVLKKKSNLSGTEINFLYLMRGYLGTYLYENRNYKMAEDELRQVFNYYRNTLNYKGAIACAEKLINLYYESQQQFKIIAIINLLKELRIPPKNTTDEIALNGIFQKYYSYKNDVGNLKKISQRLIELNHKLNLESMKNTKIITTALNNNLIHGLVKKRSDDIASSRKKYQTVEALIILTVILSAGIILRMFLNSKRKMKDIECQKKLLKNSISFQEQKISLLYQNISLKQQVEEIIMDNLKRIKNENDSESIVREMTLKINSLMNIDKKSVNLIHESSVENKQFIENLTKRCENLTKTELRLCSYFRMDLSAKEISAIENTSPGTIRVHKTKIKNKLNVPKTQNLSSFLIEL
ncbi:hypothetical protein F3J23_08215 [Chryseobacterium sp. Tr-659]|uniref:LuxR C-terminal-related transcriptional regulator n=1 Tax=Chryseobacterium sp. Tr-659 TaxID=2608340 RepID=UPI00141FEDB7|nr:LuxR C-terminal-related transcriptional regulator [Chryseobacterium sp. Tr-659]NIF05426.1 hypothetical protein [Chryseobacterium sp. Tr-659]